jgi:hypothetical protein
LSNPRDCVVHKEEHVCTFTQRLDDAAARDAEVEGRLVVEVAVEATPSMLDYLFGRCADEQVARRGAEKK